MFNKSEIMKKAWELYNEKIGYNRKYSTFALALKQAWRLAKGAAMAAKVAEAQKRANEEVIRKTGQIEIYANEVKVNDIIKSCKTTCKVLSIREVSGFYVNNDGSVFTLQDIATAETFTYCYLHSQKVQKAA